MLTKHAELIKSDGVLLHLMNSGFVKYTARGEGSERKYYLEYYAGSRRTGCECKLQRDTQRLKLKQPDIVVGGGILSRDSVAKSCNCPPLKDKPTHVENFSHWRLNQVTQVSLEDYFDDKVYICWNEVAPIDNFKTKAVDQTVLIKSLISGKPQHLSAHRMQEAKSVEANKTNRSLLAGVFN